MTLSLVTGDETWGKGKGTEKVVRDGTGERKVKMGSNLGVGRSMHVRFLKPVEEGDGVWIRCEVVSLGRRMCELIEATRGSSCRIS